MTTSTTLRGFKFAELARGEGLQSPDTCECCERTGLKKTVKLVHPSGRVVWYGTGCASKAMGVGSKVVEGGRRDAEDTLRGRENAERDAIRRAEDAEFQAFLDAAAGPLKAWDGKADRSRQLEALGGYPAAKAAFQAWRASR